MPFPSALTFPGAATFPGIGGPGRIFRPPTRDLPFRLAGRGLIGSYTQGLSVWRANGAWHTGLSPSAEQRAAADRFYLGGIAHPIADDEYSELVAGGFAAYIEETQ